MIDKLPDSNDVPMVNRNIPGLFRLLFDKMNEVVDTVNRLEKKRSRTRSNGRKTSAKTGTNGASD